MTSAENSVSEPPNLKFSEGGYPQTLLQGSSEGNNLTTATASVTYLLHYPTVLPVALW